MHEFAIYIEKIRKYDEIMLKKKNVSPLIVGSFGALPLQLILTHENNSLPPPRSVANWKILLRLFTPKSKGSKRQCWF